MAAKPSEEGKPFVQGIVDESCSIPISYSGFKIVKPSFGETKHQGALDILPILVEETSLPKSSKHPVDNSHAQDIYSISVLPQESNNLQCTSQLAFLRFLEVPDPAKDDVLTDAELNCQDCIDIQMNSSDTYSTCVVDIDVEKESLQIPDEKAVESLKTECVPIHLQKALRRQASINVGEKIIQLLVNDGTASPRDKTGVEKVHETTNNHWRKYKRAASFDSRKIVLLFSIFISSFGRKPKSSLVVGNELETERTKQALLQWLPLLTVAPLIRIFSFLSS